MFPMRYRNNAENIAVSNFEKTVINLNGPKLISQIIRYLGIKGNFTGGPNVLDGIKILQKIGI